MQHINGYYHSRPSASPLLKTMILTLSLSMAGCGFLKKDKVKPPPPQPTQIPLSLELMLVATPDANPNTSGKPSPIRLRVFLADSSIEFADDAFESVFEFNGASPPANPEAILMLQPGASKTITLNGNQSQSQLVVAAAFHNLYSAQWIARKTIDPKNLGTITATVTSISVDIR